MRLWIPVATQVYDAVPMLRSYIDTDLTIGLEQAEENELLLGAGTTGHMSGLDTQRAAYSASGIPAGVNKVDHIRWAKLQVRKSFFPATAVVLNPEDWDNFVRNMLTLRGEGRLALTMTRPSASVGGAFPAPTP